MQEILHYLCTLVFQIFRFTKFVTKLLLYEIKVINYMMIEQAYPAININEFILIYLLEENKGVSSSTCKCARLNLVREK